MKANNLWCVVIGQPRLECWSKDNPPPMSSVGRVYGGNGAFYNTRKEARNVAKAAANSNRYWYFHPKKVGPI